jgi:hypothetical protein
MWLDGPQSQSGYYGKEKNLLPLPRIEPSFYCPTAHSKFTILDIISIWRKICGVRKIVNLET